MPNDSAHHAFGNITPNKVDAVISYNCSHCVLIFKTRIYLYEHLHQVHGLSVDSALRDSGLKSVPQIKSKLDSSLKLGKSKPDNSLKLGKSKTDNTLKLRKTDFAFNCKNCNFKSSNWSIYCEHKQKCSDNPYNENHTAKPSFLVNKLKASSGIKETDHEKAKRKSTSTDVKNYSKSPQTITKYFAPSSTIKSDCAPSERNTQTLRLEETSSSSAGVFQVTAASIDLAQTSMSSSTSHLLSDLDRISDPTSAKPVDPFKEVPPNNNGKRMAKDVAESKPTKKTKLESEAPIVKLKTSTSELSFEVSDDEEKLDPVSKAPKTIKEYFCKHCQYNTADLMHLVSHYEDNHPYIKCNSVYIEEKSDQTAMFRCLECPVEFSSEADLHNHYSEDHPDAPEIFSLKFADLVHKCFVCPFTSKILQSLKEHYKEKHPSQKVENSLWYSKYSSPRQDGYVTRRRISEENEVPEKLETEKTTSASQEERMESAPKSHDWTLYYCGKCSFSHKSVVVMHVHYKKCHPEAPLTLDKIKQFVIPPPVRASEENPDISHSVKLEESWACPVSDPEDECVTVNRNLQQTLHTSGLDTSSPIEKRFFCHHCTFSNSNIKSVISHHNAKHGITTTIEEILRHTAEVENKHFQAAPQTTGLDNATSSSMEKMFFCHHCTFSNTNIKNLVSHHNAKHGITTTIEEILRHTAEVENKHFQAAPQTTGLDNATSSSMEKMFFCHHCTFSNTNIKNLVSHHNAKHGINATIEEILHHTAVVESKNLITVHNPETNLYACPQNLFYCKICNYGNPTLLGIMGHQNKLHAISERKESVLEYTAMIREQIEKSKSHPNDSILPSGLPLPLVKGDTRLVFCHLCNYRNKDLHVLSGHYLKSHKGFRSTPQQIAEYSSMVSEQLHASSQTISSQENLKVTDSNTQKKYKMKTTNLKPVLEPEPETGVKLKCIQCSYGTNHLYLIRKHLQSTHKNKLSLSDIVQLCGSETTFQPGYHCDVCSFWHEDMKVVRRHCMDRHARSLSDHKLNTLMYLSPDICDPKKRGCALNSNTMEAKKDSSKVQDKDDDENGDEEEGFDSYQVPLDFDNLKVSREEAKEYSCSYCSAKFEGRGGLLIHMGMKHRDEISDEMPQLEMAKHTQAFKCHSCSYVNNIKQGVVTHSLMKHPNKAFKLYSIYIAREHLKNVEMKVKNGTWKFCGFMCKDCSQVYPSKEKMRLHRETHKRQAVQNKDEEIWCQHCGLYCSSAKAHTDHLSVCHKSSSSSSSMFPCVLCQDAFITKVRLGIHYTKKHGKEAFLKHYAPLYNQPSIEVKVTAAQPSQPAKSEMVLMYKCPSCRYVNSSFHGTLTHCQMRHPKIVVRAGKLKTIELDLANMIGCLTERAKNFGGYRCRKCPLVFGGLKKLKKHCEIDHNPSAHSTSHYNAESSVSESAASGQKKLVSKFRHFFKCSLCAYSTSILKQLGNHYMQRHGKSSYIKFYSPLFHQANKPKMPLKHEMGETKDPLEQAENKVKATIPQQVYKCNACSYGSLYRRYLIAHFKNRHKYDSQAVYKHMEKYKNYKSTLPGGQFPCKKCHHVAFETKGRLLAHYQTFHTSEMQIDFTIVAERTDRTTGVFRCNYCKKKIYGIKNICKHLDQHRARRLKDKKMENEVSGENTFPSLDPVDDETELNVTSEETVSPASASCCLGPEVPEVSEEQPSDIKHTCQRCKRSFKSLKGLRSHERSHAALAALDSATASDSQEHINQYISYRTGTTRPFMCTFCPYRTSVLSLGKNHIMKKHPYVLNSAAVHLSMYEATQKEDEASPSCVDDMNADDDEPANSYLEPPDVQRQLKHYSAMAQMDPASKTQNVQLSDPRMLPCEMCNFNCQHYSAMRRHYLRRHGKKLIRCKDCNFFSCFKQNLDLHEQMGHSTLQSEPTHQKNLCCPFCLYQSKNKNNMIDHIVLHREERVMPIEVRRSKLSRYLQGIVFQCYKCTFTSGSADSLHSHMTKHSDLKPFKCRLCYFDCTLLRDLEAHLCDKHQVVRNHQLVGQVSLDQLEIREGRISQDDDDNDDEMLDDPEKYEQTMKIKNNQQNEDQAVDAEESNPDSPKIQSIPGQNVDERFDDHANDINYEHDDHQAQRKATGDVSESSPVCMDEDQDESQDNSQNMTNKESERQNVDYLMVDDVTVLNSNQTKLDMQNHFSDKAHDRSRIDLIPPNSVESTVNQEVQKDRYKVNNTEEKSPYGEMPILEKYFKEQCLVFSQPGETSDKLSCSVMRDDCNKESSEMSNTENGFQEAHNSPPVLLASDSVDRAAVHSSVAANMFPCDLCGRSLASTSDLERHMMRHGM